MNHPPNAQFSLTGSAKSDNECPYTTVTDAGVAFTIVTVNSVASISAFFVSIAAFAVARAAATLSVDASPSIVRICSFLTVLISAAKVTLFSAIALYAACA